MGKYLERCKELRADTTRHYGCAPAVFIPVAEDHGLDHEAALNLSRNFCSGMLCGDACGAVTGALMALGLAQASPKEVTAFQQRMRDAHCGTYQCNELLDRWKSQGNTERKPHCDAMCFECMEQVEKILGIE